MDSEDISFEDLGLDEQTLAAVARKGFITPSPIQVLAIPRLLGGDANVIARARTGTGKTAAFGLPPRQICLRENMPVPAIRCCGCMGGMHWCSLKSIPEEPTKFGSMRGLSAARGAGSRSMAKKKPNGRHTG